VSDGRKLDRAEATQSLAQSPDKSIGQDRATVQFWHTTMPSLSAAKRMNAGMKEALTTRPCIVVTRAITAFVQADDAHSHQTHLRFVSALPSFYDEYRTLSELHDAICLAPDESLEQRRMAYRSDDKQVHPEISRKHHDVPHRMPFDDMGVDF
jgi:hypothetical protein